MASGLFKRVWFPVEASGMLEGSSQTPKVAFESVEDSQGIKEGGGRGTGSLITLPDLRTAWPSLGCHTFPTFFLPHCWLLHPLHLGRILMSEPRVHSLGLFSDFCLAKIFRFIVPSDTYVQ